MSVNVYRSIASPRCLMSLGGNIVADEGDNNASISILVFYRLKVVTIRELCARSGPRVLILGLKKDDWSSIGDLRFGDNFSDVFHVIFGIIEVIRCPQYRFRPLQPAWKAASGYFCVDIRAGSCKEIYSGFAGSFEEQTQRENTLGNEMALVAFQEGPIGVERDAVVTKCLDFLEYV